MSEETRNLTTPMKPDLNAFTALWGALRATYEGTNVTKTVARLLNMYRPRDGILAYERLLRTLFFLLEDFDRCSLHLLVSMIPSPTGVSSKLLNEVFYKATGFIRVNAPLYQCQNSSNNVMTIDILNLNVVDESKNNMSRNVAGDIHVFNVVNEKDGSRQPKESSEMLPANVEVFRGFPANEIAAIPNHAEVARKLCTLTNCCFSEAQVCASANQDIQCGAKYASVVLPSFNRPQSQSVFFTTEANRYVKIPVSKGNLGGETEFFDLRLLSPRPLLLRRDAENLRVSPSCMRVGSGARDRDILYDIELHRLEEELQTKRATIQRNIAKMDVVYWNEENRCAIENQEAKLDDSVGENLIVTEGLKSSIEKFLKRAREDSVIQVPGFPETRAPASPETWKCVGNSEEVGNRENLPVKSWDVRPAGKRGQGKGVDVISLPDVRRATQRKKVDQDAKSSRRSRSQNVKQQQRIRARPSGLLNVPPNYTQLPGEMGRSPFSAPCSENSCTMDVGLGSKCLFRMGSKGDLVPYKRKYCDAFLNAQKSMAGSFTVSSSGSITGCDTCYLSYLHDQPNILQQDLPARSELPTRLCNSRNIPYAWLNTPEARANSADFQDIRKIDYRYCVPNNQETKSQFEDEKRKGLSD